MKYLINRASAISPREDLDLLVKSKKKLRIKTVLLGCGVKNQKIIKLLDKIK